MKLFYLKSIILFCLVTLCFSCKKSENLNENNTEMTGQDISVKNGMLVFRNSEVLKTTIRQVSGLSAKEYAQWVKTYPGFQSYKLAYHQAVDAFESIETIDGLSDFKEKYKNIVAITKDTSLTEVFASPVISNFVNKEGQFRVGDSLNILTNDKWILLTSSDRGKLSKALSLNKTDSVNGIYISDYRESETMGKHIENNREESFGSTNSIMSLVDPPVFPGQYPFKIGTPDYMRSSGVFFDQTYYNGDRDRRLFVKLIHDVYPTGGTEFNPTSTSIFSLYVHQESKKLFGWGANNTSFDVKIDYIVVGRSTAPTPSGYVYYNYGSNAPIWQRWDTKGPFTFTLFNGDGFSKALWGSMRIWTQGVPNNPTNI